MIAMTLRQIILSFFCSVGLMFLLGCENRQKVGVAKSDQKTSSIVEKPQPSFESIDECFLLHYLLAEECVKHSSRLDHDSLRTIEIVFPLVSRKLSCSSLEINKTQVNLRFEDFDLNIIKHVRSTRDNPLRVFYLLKTEMNTHTKMIELFYGPSNSIYKIQANLTKSVVEIEEVVCANF